MKRRFSLSIPPLVTLLVARRSASTFGKSRYPLALLVLTTISLAMSFLLSWKHVAAATLDSPWLSHDERGQPKVHLYFFWSPTCPHCQAAKPFVTALPQRLPWLVLHSHDVTDRAHAQAYVELAADLGETARSAASST